MALPIDITPQLFHAMLHRKGVKVLRSSGGKSPVNLSERIKTILDTPENLEPWQD